MYVYSYKYVYIYINSYIFFHVFPFVSDFFQSFHRPRKCGKFEDVLLRAVLREEWSKISEQLISRVRERYAVELGGS